MKLKDWSDKEGIAYITAYRWFKAGKLPVNAYQTESGTIIVEDEVSEPTISQDNRNNSPVAQIIKKAVEISKSGASVEDLATFVISNFKLSEQDIPEPVTRRARMKPTKEMTNKHFQKFLKSDKAKPEANMFLVNQGDLEKVVAASEKASSIEGDLGIEFAGAQNYGTLIPSSASLINKESNTIASVMQPLIQSLVATPKTYTSIENGVVFTRATGDGAIATNSTLSAANAISSVSNFTTQASSSVIPGSYYCSSNILESNVTESTVEEAELVFTNEAQVYNPVTYDEARALLKLTSNVTDPLTLDRRAKQLCQLDRDSFDGIMKAAQNTRK